MQDSITHEALEALSKKATQGPKEYATFVNVLFDAYRTGQLIHAVPSGDGPEAAARIQALETSLAEARRQALEEAAKVAARWDKFRWNGIDIDDARDVSAQIAQAIRALADPLLDRQGDGKEGV